MHESDLLERITFASCGFLISYRKRKKWQSGDEEKGIATALLKETQSFQSWGKTSQRSLRKENLQSDVHDPQSCQERIFSLVCTRRFLVFQFTTDTICFGS